MTNVLTTVVAASLMDRAGRKQLLTLSFTGMGISMLAMAAGLGFKQLAGLSSTVAIVGTVAYVISFALGAGPVPGLLVPEITPARLRGACLLPRGLSVSSACLLYMQSMQCRCLTQCLKVAKLLLKCKRLHPFALHVDLYCQCLLGASVFLG